MGKGTRVAIFSVAGAFLTWNKGGSQNIGGG